MTTQRDGSKHVLFLGLDHDFAEHVAIWLATEGVHLVGLGSESDRLMRIKREVAARGGQFDFLSADVNHVKTLETCLESLIYQFDGVGCVISVADLRLPQRHLYRSGLEIQPHDRLLVKTYQTLCSQYRDIPPLTRVVNVVLVSQPPTATQVESDHEIAQDYLFLVEPSYLTIGQTLPQSERSPIPVEWVGRALLKRLSASGGGATQLIELVGGEGILYDWGADSTASRKLGKALPVIMPT